MTEQSRFLIDFRMAGGESPPSVLIYDHIGIERGKGTSSEAVAAFLAENRKAAVVEVHINSTGGFAAEGIAMFNSLRQFPGDVVTINHGHALSAAALVFLAGDRRLVSPGSHVMIHRASLCGASGNADVLRKVVRSLDDLDRSVAEMIAERVGKAAADVLDLMSAETWFTSEEAVRQKWATGLTGANPSMQATADLSGFKNVPPSIAQWRNAMTLSNCVQIEGEPPRPREAARTDRFAINF